MNVTIVSATKDGNRFIVTCQAEFDATNLSSEECVQKVKEAFSAIDARSPKLAAITIDKVQKETNKMLGLSDEVFAKYDTNSATASPAHASPPEFRDAIRHLTSRIVP